MTTEDGPRARLEGELRLPFTYAECRARFRRAAQLAGLDVESHPIRATGPDGGELTIEVVGLGADRPRRALVILSGVHGVEGFIGSALQTDLIGRLDPAALPDDVGLVIVHGVNPWGMAHNRRQNESNVDLNRNWRRDHIEPTHNDAYDEIHALACPDTRELPSVDDLWAATSALVAERGLAWVRDAITKGQYRHPDGLHYGGERSEESTLILESVLTERLADATQVLTVDLHTAHGPRGEITLLSDQPPGSPQDELLRRWFPAVRVEATADNPEATTGVKSGQIANGIAQVAPAATCVATAAEFGTAPDEEQLVATYHEQWAHRMGVRDDPAHAEVVWAYRRCFTPDDPEWEDQALPAGRALLSAAVEAITDWRV